MIESISVVLFSLQLVLAYAGSQCMVNQPGGSVLVYCESSCCDTACCTQAEDSRVAYIALGVVIAIILIAIIALLVVWCLRHKKCFRKAKDKEKVKPKDNTVSVYDEAEEAVC